MKGLVFEVLEKTLGGFGYVLLVLLCVALPDSYKREENCGSFLRDRIETLAAIFCLATWPFLVFLFSMYY